MILARPVRSRLRWSVLAALVLLCFLSPAGRSADMSDPSRARILPTWWKGADGLLLTNADNGKVFAYASDVGDTTGTTIWATYTAAFSIWTFTDFPTDLYTIKHVDDVHGETLLAEGYSLDGAVLGDGQVNRAAVFGAGVLPPGALNADSVYAFSHVAVDSIAANDSSLIAVSSPVTFDSVLTIGAYVLPIADGGANTILKTDGAGTVTWQTDATGAGGSAYAESLETADGRYDADSWFDASGDIDTTNVTTAQWEAYIQGHQAAETGDISAVTAGLGLVGGGTSGAVACSVAVDAAGGIEIGDDSLNVKLDGSTLTVSASGIRLATALDMGGDTSLEIPNGNNPTTNAEGEVAWDANDDAIEVYSGDEAESALIPVYQRIDVLIMAPDGVADEIPILHVDAILYPFGIEIDQVSITIPADAAYSMVFEEWAGDPPAAQADIETVSTGAGDSYMEVAQGDIDNASIDADDYVFLHVPATDVDWIHCQVIYHVMEGN